MAIVGNHNIAKMTSITQGTGTLTLGSAVNGFLTFALAGVANGERLTITIRDGVNTETSRGTYTASGTTISRDTVLSSTNGGSKISCSGRQTVAITTAAEDLQPFAYYTDSTVTTIANGATNTVLHLDTETLDNYSLGSVATNKITIAKKGWYSIFISYGHYTNGADYNGTIFVGTNVSGGITGSLLQGYVTAWAISTDEGMISIPLVQIAADATSYVEVLLTNNSGASIDAYINYVAIHRWGNV